MFTDIEGSTRLLNELGEAEYARALAEHRRVLRDVFGNHGYEVNYEGDEFFYALARAEDADRSRSASACTLASRVSTRPSAA